MIIGVAIALALLTVLLPKRAYPPQSLVKKAD
jgi:DHA2 family multidrug resistance protein